MASLTLWESCDIMPVL